MTPEELEIYQIKQYDLERSIESMLKSAKFIDRLNKEGIKIPALHRPMLGTIAEVLEQIRERNPE